MATARASVVQVRFDESTISFGVIVSDEGHVLTSPPTSTTGNGRTEETDRTTEVTVVTSHGELKGTVLASDSRTRLAVVEVTEPVDAAPPVVGTSDAVAEGDQVTIFGLPTGGTGTQLSGTIQSTRRVVGGIGMLTVQATGGSLRSGGLVVDRDGKVVGVLSGTMMSGGAEIGLAVPAELAFDVAGQLIENGSVAHPYLGVSVKSTRDGVAVVSVSAGSPAERAGLRQGDLIVDVAGNAVRTPDDLVAAVQSRAIGEELAITYQRGGTERKTTVTLAQAPQ
ncbi:MAG TPA: PDZ domain-containing protein [Actinopolymorphaceae bacterium]|jgi:putative serine protease PepD